MKNGLRLIAGWAASMVRRARVRGSLGAVLAAVLLLRSHVVRELVAAEFLFALAFVVVLAAAGAAWVVIFHRPVDGIAGQSILVGECFNVTLLHSPQPSRHPHPQCAPRSQSKPPPP